LFPALNYTRKKKEKGGKKRERERERERGKKKKKREGGKKINDLYRAISVAQGGAAARNYRKNIGALIIH